MRRQVTYPGWLFVLFALYFLQTGLVGGIFLMGGVSWYEGLPLALRFVPAYELAGCVALVNVANRYGKFLAPGGGGNLSKPPNRSDQSPSTLIPPLPELAEKRENNDRKTGSGPSAS